MMDVAYVPIKIARDLGGGKIYSNDRLLGFTESVVISEEIKIEIPVSSVHITFGMDLSNAKDLTIVVDEYRNYKFYESEAENG